MSYEFHSTPEKDIVMPLGGLCHSQHLETAMFGPMKQLSLVVCLHRSLLMCHFVGGGMVPEAILFKSGLKLELPLILRQLEKVEPQIVLVVSVLAFCTVEFSHMLKVALGAILIGTCSLGYIGWHMFLGLYWSGLYWSAHVPGAILVGTWCSWLLWVAPYSGAL